MGADHTPHGPTKSAKSMKILTFLDTAVVRRISLWRLCTCPSFRKTPLVLSPDGYCWACGTKQVWLSAKIINDELAGAWEINRTIREAFDARESMFCPNCGASCRSRSLSEAICRLYHNTNSLENLVTTPGFQKLRVAEINSCGTIHRLFSRLPYLSYSEYNSTDPAIRSEDLHNLSYSDSTFDLVFSSDTLEHVPNLARALSEIYRILKPGGRHVFTIPVVWNRQTRTRAVLQGTIINHLETPSYHGNGGPDYLVFTEFGGDAPKFFMRSGFEVRLFGINLRNLEDPSGVFVATRMGEVP